jgi:undecaprenyl-diphosphatase
VTTFQALAHALVQGITEFLPLGPVAHRMLLTHFMGWPEPPPALLGAMSGGSFMALLIYFAHDWASMFSSLLQVVIYRKKPMTIDERMPLFILITAIPMAAGWYYFHENLISTFSSIPIVLGSLAGFGALLWLADAWSRRNKGMYDWNIFDSLIVGVLGVASVIPGCGQRTATLSASLLRGFSREAATKYGFYVATPLLAAAAFTQLRGFDWSSPPISSSDDELSWLSLGVAFVVAFFASLLAIATLTRNIQRTGMTQFVAWRLVIALAAGVYYYWNQIQGY